MGSGLMDQFNQGYEAPPRTSGAFAKSEQKASLWVNKTPFAITHAPFTRRKNERFIEQGKEPNEWVIQIRLMELGSDGQLRWLLTDDGEGGREPVDLVLNFSVTPQRSYALSRMVEYFKTTNAQDLGPFRLDKDMQAEGTGNKPWILVDWINPTPAPTPFPTGAPVGASAYAPTPQPAAPPVAASPAPVLSSQGKPFTHVDASTGKKLGWHEGLPGWEEVREAAQPPPLPAGPPPLPVVASQEAPPGTVPPPQPLPGQSNQPIPATKLIQGYTRDEAYTQQIAAEVADGTQIRQAVYQGEGKVMQPSGIETQNAAGVEPRTQREAGGFGTPQFQAAQTPVTAGGALGVEEPAPEPQAPPGAPQQAGGDSVQVALRQAYHAGQPIGVEFNCDVCYEKISVAAWYDKKSGAWKQSHSCSKTKNMRTLIVTDAVKKVVGVV